VSRIYVRSLDSTEARTLPGTEGAIHPFWSPDGRSLGFAAGNSLKRIDLAGGSARSLADLTGPWHGSWNQTGIILYQSAGIQGMPAEGGAPTPAVTLDGAKGESSSGFPFFLSDGKRFLTMIGHGDGSRNIELATLGSGKRKVILPGVISAPVLAPAPNGRAYLLYFREASLMAQEFDEKAESVRGSPFLLIDGIGLVANPPLRPAVGVSPGGVLAYQTANDAGDVRLAWIDRNGKQLQELPVAAAGASVTLSPDGRFAATTKRSTAGSDVWLVDLSSGSATRLTFASNGSSDGSPIWSPDGKRVAYRSAIGGIYARNTNGTGPVEEITKSEAGYPLSWSPDGQQILYGFNNRLFLLPLSGSKVPVAVGPAQGVTSLGGGRISPDGKYLAFPATESGHTEIVVEEMPPGTGKWQISNGGGTQPRWRRDGKELFFLSPDSKIMAADIQAGQGIAAGIPRALFQTAISGQLGSPYDVSADGQRFLIAASSSAVDAPITVVLNWWAELKSK
jgi:hypothetical protein